MLELFEDWLEFAATVVFGVLFLGVPCRIFLDRILDEAEKQA